MLIDRPGLDTKLARLLHKQGRLDVSLLRTVLEETRARRTESGWTLARLLVHRGVLDETEAADCIARLSAPATRDNPLRASLAESGERPKPSEGERWAAGDTVGGSDKGSTVVVPAAGDRTQGNRTQGDRLASSSDSGELSAWYPGIRIKDYRIIDRLGAGGMGVVYMAEDLRTHVRYALKTLFENAEPEVIARFMREGEAQATVDAHPNVVRIHATGNALGRHYLVMDLASGGDLAEKLRRGPLEPDEAARIVRDLARGLAYMHTKGVLHRDLKPANVLFDQAGTPKLVDFGIALVDGASRLTMTGDALGTPSFMAPEQVLAIRDALGPWTDVYGLGAVLYIALTGEDPYRAGTVMEIMDKVVAGNLVPPRQIRPEIPPELDALCVRAMSRDAPDRPTAVELGATLDRYLEARKTAGPRPTKAPPRSRAFLVPVILVLAGLLAFAGIRGRGKATPPPRSPPGDEARTTLPRPGLPAFTGSAAVSATPSEKLQPVAAGGAALLWRWEVGRVSSCTLTLSATWTLPRPRGAMNIDMFRRYTLSWRAERVEPSHVTVAARIEGLEFRYVVQTDEPLSEQMRELLEPVAFDSARSEDSASPLARAIGGSFTLDLDPRTGRVTEVHDVTAIQSAIWGAVAEERMRQRFRVTELLSAGEMVSTLNALFHNVPEGEASSHSSWALTRTAPPSIDHGGRLAVRALVTTHEVPGGGMLVSWNGSTKVGSTRELSGNATFAAGRYRKIDVTEDITTPEGAGILRMEFAEPPPAR